MSWELGWEPMFVDSSAWIALFSKRDRFHVRARDMWRQLHDARRFLLTNDYVLDETFTLLRRGPNGLLMAEALHDLITQSRVIEVETVSEELWQRGWKLFTRYRDKVLSFTDCVSFAHLQARDLYEVFTFDGDFERAGFVVRP